MYFFLNLLCVHVHLKRIQTAMNNEELSERSPSDRIVDAPILSYYIYLYHNLCIIKRASFIYRIYMYIHVHMCTARGIRIYASKRFIESLVTVHSFGISCTLFDENIVKNYQRFSKAPLRTKSNSIRIQSWKMFVFLLENVTGKIFM